MNKIQKIIKELNALKIKQTQVNWQIDILNKKTKLLNFIGNPVNEYVNSYREMGYETAVSVIDMGSLGYLGIRHITSLFEGVTYKSVNYTLHFVEMQDITDHTKMFIEIK